MDYQYHPPASAFFNAINNKLIPNAIPKKPLKKDFKIIEKLIGIGDVKYLEFTKKVQLIIKKDIVVLIAAEAIGSAPKSSIGFIIIRPID